jgi:putative holliday junction resolvase
MLNQTLLAFDVGSHKIGVAVGQTLIGSATPLARLPAKNGLPEKQAIKQLLSAWRPQAIIVGIPTKMDGSKQFTTALAYAFVAFLKSQTDVPIHLVDERLTTKSARSELFAQGGFKKLKNADVDGYAAKILIESWINESHN